MMVNRFLGMMVSENGFLLVSGSERNAFTALTRNGTLTTACFVCFFSFLIPKFSFARHHILCVPSLLSVLVPQKRQ